MLVHFNFLFTTQIKIYVYISNTWIGLFNQTRIKLQIITMRSTNIDNFGTLARPSRVLKCLVFQTRKCRMNEFGQAVLQKWHFKWALVPKWFKIEKKITFWHEWQSWNVTWSSLLMKLFLFSFSCHWIAAKNYWILVCPNPFQNHSDGEKKISVCMLNNKSYQIIVWFTVSYTCIMHFNQWCSEIVQSPVYIYNTIIVVERG